MKKNELMIPYIELMLKTWRNESVVFNDLDVSYDSVEKCSYSIRSISDILNKEEKMNDKAIVIEKYIEYLIFEKSTIVFLCPSYHLSKTLFQRHLSMEWKEMVPSKLFDPILERIEEINQIFTEESKNWSGKDIPGEEFISFLKDKKISPYIFFQLYFNSRSASSTVFSLSKCFSYLPFCFKIKIKRSEIVNAKTLAQQSVVEIIFS